MIGRKMALVVSAKIHPFADGMYLPETEEEDTEENGQDAHTDCLCLLEDLDNAVQKRSNPEEPFEEGCEHERADNGDIDDLLQLVGALAE